MKTYEEKFLEYKKQVKKLGIDTDVNTLEFNFESLNDWSLFHTFEQIKKWYKMVQNFS